MMNTQWSLFLDRDGVINERIIGGYVRNCEELVIKEDFIPAMKILRPLFGKVFIVTNQQGIGKGLMTEAALGFVHNCLKKKLKEDNILIDGIYVCPHLESAACDCRKPDIGLAKQAKRDFPSVDFKKSVMVGDSVSDILFGKRCGMKTVFVGEEMLHPEINSNLMPDYYCENLLEFAHLLEK